METETSDVESIETIMVVIGTIVSPEQITQKRPDKEQNKKFREKQIQGQTKT